ncbi:MAG: hypothetical protein ACR2P1_27760 [Pseudomonadales bacterium]
MQLQSSRQANAGEKAEHQILHCIYLYYLFGLIFSGPIGPTIGFLLALNQREHMATAFGKSHIVYQISMFRQCAGGLAAGLSVILISATIMEGRSIEISYAYIPLAGLTITFIFAISFLTKCALGMSNANAGLEA